VNGGNKPTAETSSDVVQRSNQHDQSRNQGHEPSCLAQGFTGPGGNTASESNEPRTAPTTVPAQRQSCNTQVKISHTTTRALEATNVVRTWSRSSRRLR